MDCIGIKPVWSFLWNIKVKSMRSVKVCNKCMYICLSHSKAVFIVEFTHFSFVQETLSLIIYSLDWSCWSVITPSLKSKIFNSFSQLHYWRKCECRIHLFCEFKRWKGVIWISSAVKQSYIHIDVEFDIRGISRNAN